MLNYLWAGMLLAGVVCAAFTGNMKEVTNAVLASCEEAVSLCITMTGVTSFWVGLMEIAARAGIIEAMSEKMRPIIRLLFPKLPKDHGAVKYIAANMIANMLGLGWAATPAGLKAMTELEGLEEDRRVGKARGRPQKRGAANDEMCTFLILNISSLQLIPVNVIAFRSKYGSAEPAKIIGAGLAATAVSTLAAIVYCRIKGRRGG